MPLKKRLKKIIFLWIASKKKDQFVSREIRSILVFRYDRIGDMVVTTPLLAEIKRQMPFVELCVLASSQNQKILEYADFVDKVYIYNKKNILKILQLLIKLRNKKFSLLIDLNHSFIWRFILEAKIIKPRWIVSPKKGVRYGIKPYEVQLYDRYGTEAVNKPLSYVYLDLLKVINCQEVNLTDSKYRVPFGVTEQAYADSLFLQKNSPYIGLNLFGSRNEMRLSTKTAIAVVEEIQNSFLRATVILFCTDQNYSEVLHLLETLKDNSKIGVKILMAPPTASILNAAALIKRLNLLITPDTALVHIACAFGIPLVAVYTSQMELYEQWRPLNESSFEIIFSGKEKSLEGYSEKELLSCVQTQIVRIKNLKSSL